MTQRNRRTTTWKSALAGGLVCPAVGWALLWFGGWPVLLSYDLLFPVRSAPTFTNVVILYLDESSFKELDQTSVENWDRNLHARLLDRLREDQNPLAVFDVVLSEPGTPAANTRLATAMQRHGKVVLAAALDYQSRPQIKVERTISPRPEFEAAAAGWGIAELVRSAGQVARQYYEGSEGPSLVWAAAKVAGLDLRQDPRTEAAHTWINYYGPPFTIPSLSYCDAAGQPAGYFSNKFVFVGARPKTAKAHDEVDEFPTPYTLWTSQLSAGVEINATAFLNLMRNEPLARTPWRTEWLLVLLVGVLFGSLCGLLRPAAAVALSLLGTLALLVAAVEAAKAHLWFPWTVLALGQFPAGLAWALRCQFHRLRFERDVLERTLEETARHAPAASVAAGGTERTGLEIPDHQLVSCIGQGAYGQVWLAQNAVGMYHAVKIVRRRAFSSDEPYEREYKGIQKFMPISRSHPGLVHVLHVGRNDTLGFFFYIMEAADDLSAGQRFNPARYSPKTLASALELRGPMPPLPCLELAISLSTALDYLHQQGLVHRDIKPGNIIFARDIPKFADIGLVTDVAATGQEISCVGTEGYVPPEGPGKPTADIYALGKVLYEAAMGRDRRLFPEIPTAILEQPEDSLLRQLNQVICKACATNPPARYPTARELHTALLKLRVSGVD